ncbi:response regulator transcription factor [Arthrobacter rhombi]|uniref:response regulator transcription factor n=1 Tax=Arthrobacter rhombi TaxID=71253 RepID=UPI0031D88BA5
MQRVDTALKRLRSVQSVDELASMIPGEVVGLGYARALFSWVENMRWIAHSAHSLAGPAEGRELIEAGHRRPFQHIRHLFEHEVVITREAILREDIRDSDQVHPELMKVTHSRSYIAAPLVNRRGTMGFVHLDADANGDPVTELDRKITSLFCEGASYALERAQALEDVAALEAGIRNNATALEGLLQGLGTAGPVARPATLHLPPGHAVSSSTPADDAATALTRREEQVLELIAHGLTNSQIGGRLFITEGTAKSHVKNVLHKLGASNRTEAAALYREGHPGT